MCSQKLELLSALGLMTREALRELQHRRGERKRRTTANPHFSSAALEEKRRNALLLIGENMASGRKCQKGRNLPLSSLIIVYFFHSILLVCD